MADNTELNPGAGGDIIAADDVAGVKYQIVKLDLGGNGASAPVAGTFPVSGTFWQATQPVSGPITNAELRASAVPVTGTFYQATQPISVASLPLPTGAATEATILLSTKQKNAASNVADYGQVILAQRRDSDTPETTADGQYTALKQDQAGRLKVATQPGDIATTTGSITASAQTVFILTTRVSTISIAMVATSLVGHNSIFEVSVDSTNGTDGNWKTVQAVRTDSNIIETATGVLAATPSYAWELNVAAYQYFRIRATAHTSGTAAYTIKPAAYATEPVPSSQNPDLILFPYSVAGVIAINTDLITIDCAKYKSVSIQCLSMGTAGVVTAQWANDSAFTAPITATLLSESGATSTTFNAAVLRTTNVLARYLRLRLTTATTAGTTTINVQASQSVLSPIVTTQPVSGTVSVTGYPTAAASADALANPTVTKVDATQLTFNGTSWDRARGMSTALTTGDTGAKTATGNGATITNVGNKGVQILVNMGAVSGTTPTCVLKVQGSTDGGTSWYDVPGATTASLTATGLYGITIYPGVAVTAGSTTTGTTATASMVIPRTWRVVWTIGGTTPSFTITAIQYIYLPN